MASSSSDTSDDQPLISGLWLGEATPAAALASSVPANPICWSLTLMPRTKAAGAAPTVFGGGFFDDSGDVPGSPVLLFTLSGSWDGASKAVTLSKRYQNRAVPEELTVEYEGTLGREPDGAYAIKGSWVNALEGTTGTFACRLEGSETVARGTPPVAE